MSRVLHLSNVNFSPECRVGRQITLARQLNTKLPSDSKFPDHCTRLVKNQWNKYWVLEIEHTQGLYCISLQDWLHSVGASLPALRQLAVQFHRVDRAFITRKEWLQVCENLQKGKCMEFDLPMFYQASKAVIANLRADRAYYRRNPTALEPIKVEEEDSDVMKLEDYDELPDIKQEDSTAAENRLRFSASPLIRSYPSSPPTHIKQDPESEGLPANHTFALPQVTVNNQTTSEPEAMPRPLAQLSSRVQPKPLSQATTQGQSQQAVAASNVNPFPLTTGATTRAPPQQVVAISNTNPHPVATQTNKPAESRYITAASNPSLSTTMPAQSQQPVVARSTNLFPSTVQGASQQLVFGQTTPMSQRTTQTGSQQPRTSHGDGGAPGSTLFQNYQNPNHVAHYQGGTGLFNLGWLRR